MHHCVPWLLFPSFFFFCDDGVACTFPAWSTQSDHCLACHSDDVIRRCDIQVSDTSAKSSEDGTVVLTIVTPDEVDLATVEVCVCVDRLRSRILSSVWIEVSKPTTRGTIVCTLTVSSGLDGDGGTAPYRMPRSTWARHRTWSPAPRPRSRSTTLG